MLNLTGKYFVNKVGSGCVFIKTILAKNGVLANQESCIDPMDQSYPLDPARKVSLSSLQGTI